MTDDPYVPGGNYALPRDQSEFSRLNLQHRYFTKAVCDGKLVYDEGINLKLDEGSLRIWAVDLANEVPDSVEIHGSDVSDANFPPSHPPNVRFSVASVTSLPSEWSSKFDLVNQRLLFAALLAKEWPETLAEICRVLKPGGAVQLIEMDPRFPVPETPVNVQIRDATWKASDLLGLHFGVAGSLSDLLQAAGFVNIVDETRRMPLGKSWGEIGVQGTLSIAGGFRNVSGVIAKTGLFSSKEEYERLTDKLSEEWDVYGNHYPCKVVCARKPS